MPSLQDFVKQRRAGTDSQIIEEPDQTEDKIERDFDDQFNLTTHFDDVVLVNISRLRPYSRHPFKSYVDAKLDTLAESIKHEGLQHPIIVRAVDCVQGYEILAGHNRVAAMKKLGKRDIPAIVRILDDNKAALVVVNTNLEQRDKLLPSEKAFAYKLQMEALQISKYPIIKNDRKPSDTNDLTYGGQFVHHSKGRDVLAENHDETGRSIQRYIRLTHLITELLDLLDKDEYPIMAGYEISFLDADAQRAVLRYFFEDDEKDKLSLKNAETIRAAYQSSRPITADTIYSILHKPAKNKPGLKSYSIPHKTIKLFELPDDFNFEDFVLGALEQTYKRKT